MAVGRIFNASLERVGDRSAVSLESNSPKMPSKILRSLSPVVSNRAAVGGETEPEYVFMFQSGRNPIVFNIRVRGDALCYRVGNIDYEGGDAESFRSAVEEFSPLFQ